MAQQHCLPLEISRKLHHDAVRSYLQDTVINELSGKITLLESEKASIRDSFTELLKIEQEKSNLQAGKFEDQVRISDSYSEQLKYISKKERKARRGRNVAIGLGVVLMIVAVAK